jgi:hypothetical protein
MKTRELVAIPSPAPSIPARFRLYHGGSVKRGYLVTQEPDSSSYLGDFVYFSSVRGYAEQYMKKQKRKNASLFVLDARYVPEGTRVMVGDATWPPRAVEGLLCDLIDFNWEVHTWLALLQNGQGRSLLDPNLGPEGSALVQRHLRHRRVLRRRSGPQGGHATPERERRILQKARVRVLGRLVAESEPLIAATDEDDPARDRFNSSIHFFVSTYGTADVTADQVRHSRMAFREAWLDEFTVPLSHENLESMREVGLRQVQNPKVSGAHRGMIVVVPGPIRVLPTRQTAGRRPKHTARTG